MLLEVLSMAVTNRKDLLYKIADTLEEARKFKPIEDVSEEVVEYNFVCCFAPVYGG